MENEIAVAEYKVVNFEETAMSKDRIMNQLRIVNDVMTSVMRDGEHYGVIPGCGKKPSLLKPGAEKLSLTFRLAPRYEITKNDLGSGHREYEIICNLYHIPTNQFVGQGVGACSTMEGKFRYRVGITELTGQMVPKEYWKDRDIKLIGGKGHTTKKNDAGQWEIAIQGERVEYDNPADYYNTVLKMAKKRAHVDAILTATGASDIFTQDVEDMPEVIPRASKKESDKPPIQQPKEKSEPLKTEDTMPEDTDKKKVVASLVSELTKYCMAEGKEPEEVLKSLTLFKGEKNKDVWMHYDKLNTYKEPWLGKALSNLRKLQPKEEDVIDVNADMKEPEDVQILCPVMKLHVGLGACNPCKDKVKCEPYKAYLHEEAEKCLT